MKLYDSGTANGDDLVSWIIVLNLHLSIPDMDEESKLATKSPVLKHSQPLGSDVFGDESGNAIQYKTMSWQASNPVSRSIPHLTFLQVVGLLMIAEIVSNGMLSLPNAMAAVGGASVFPFDRSNVCPKASCLR